MLYREVIFLTLMVAVISTVNGQAYSQLLKGITRARNEATNGIDTPTLSDEKSMSDSASPGFVQRASARVYSVFERMRKAVTRFIARFLLHYSKALLRRAEGDQRGGSNPRPQNNYHDPSTSLGPDFSYKINNSPRKGGDKPQPNAPRSSRLESRENEIFNAIRNQRPIPTPTYKRENTPAKPVPTTAEVPSLETVNQGETVNWSPEHIWNAVGPIQDVGRQKLLENVGKGGKIGSRYSPTTSTTTSENLRHGASSNLEPSTFFATNENFYNAPQPENPEEDVKVELVKLEYIKLDRENFTSTTENTVVEETNNVPTEGSQESTFSSSDLTISQSIELANSDGKEFVIVVDPNLKYADHTPGKSGNRLREDSRKLEAKEADAPVSILEEEARLQVPVSRQRGKPKYPGDIGESDGGGSSENFGTNYYSPAANGIVPGPEVTNPGTFSPTAYVPHPVQYPVPVYVGSLTKPEVGQVHVGAPASSAAGDPNSGSTPTPGHFLFGGKISTSSAYLDFASQIPELDSRGPPAQTVIPSPEPGSGPPYLVVNTRPVAYVLGEGGNANSHPLNYPVHSQNTPYFSQNTSPQVQYREEDYNAYYQGDSTYPSQAIANTQVDPSPQDTSSSVSTPRQGLLVNAANGGGQRQADIPFGETASKYPSTSLQDISNINALGGQYAGQGRNA
ncbi:uncharacterized protein LOC124159082 [Ischnura elegans]|uniref:uncharacterized protein LOC124159082 n=1 Tax=Ischnura elegans TaxID=197161 RepID=UPI001ED88D22|nr:uncharacterized protein LOC124159082 [Ischnura elegans]